MQWQREIRIYKITFPSFNYQLSSLENPINRNKTQFVLLDWSEDVCVSCVCAGVARNGIKLVVDRRYHCYLT